VLSRTSIFTGSVFFQCFLGTTTFHIESLPALRKNATIPTYSALLSVVKSYRELLAQRAQVDAEIAAARAAKRRAALQQIRQIMIEYGITTAELEGRRRKKRGPRVSPASKHRDSVTGNPGSGRNKTSC
jgi:DNA-binding protein H-NS